MKRQQNLQNFDSLDRASQEFGRDRSISTPNQINYTNYRQDLLLKNIYRQQLDQLTRQKNQQRQLQKQKAIHQRQMYNKRLKQGQQAQRLKDISYKNYYQLLMSNQSNKVKNYVQLNKQREQIKQKFIQQGIKQQQNRSQLWYQKQLQRKNLIKRSYQQQLARQIQQKHYKMVKQKESQIKQQQQFKKITYTPQEVAQFQKQKKLAQMTKYKQDLDRISPQIGQKSRAMTGSNIVNGKSSNDFNIYNQRIHNPMINPLPYNIQNPYILRQFNRRQYLKNQSAYFRPSNNIS